MSESLGGAILAYGASTIFLSGGITCLSCAGYFGARRIAMLWGLMVVLLVLWLLGFLVVPIAGGLIHLLLVIALVVLIYQLVTGRRSL
jgi:hypothetical protein